MVTHCDPNHEPHPFVVLIVIVLAAIASVANGDEPDPSRKADVDRRDDITRIDRAVYLLNDNMLLRDGLTDVAEVQWLYAIKVGSRPWHLVWLDANNEAIVTELTGGLLYQRSDETETPATGNELRPRKATHYAVDDPIPDRANLDALLKRIAVECPAARAKAEAVTVGGTKDLGIGGTARFSVLAPPGDNLAQRLADAAEAAAGVWDGKCHLSYRDRPDERVDLWNCYGTDLGDNRLWIYGPKHRWLDLTREAVVRMVQP